MKYLRVSVFCCVLYLFLPAIMLGKARPGVYTPPNINNHLLFIENKGQIVDQHYSHRHDIDFKLNAPGMNIFIGDGEIHYQFSNVMIGKCDDLIMPGRKSDDDLKESKTETYRLDVVPLNANKNAEIITEEPQDYYENYYLAQCPDGVTAHSFRKITYKNIYPHID